MAAVEEEDPAQVRAAQILVSLRNRKLLKWPEWVPKQPSGEASSSPPGTMAAAAKVMPSREASSSPGTVAVAKAMSSGGEASLGGTVTASVPLRTRPERVSMQSGVVSFATTTVAAGVPERWPKAKRTGARGQTSKELEQGHAAAAAAVAKGSGAPRSSERERCTETPAASAQRQPVVAALCYPAVAVAGSGPSVTSDAPAKTPSPNSPLDYGAGGSGAPSSADTAAPAAKRKGTSDDDDEGCRSPTKRVPVAEVEKPVPISVEPSGQSASSGKGAPRLFDLNLPPCPDEGDEDCPDTT